jgi:hypothetical protein
VVPDHNDGRTNAALMAGQPKRRAMLAELERRTREELGDESTHLDYAEYWLESGKTMYDLARSISGALGMQVMYASLNRYIESLSENARDRLSHARARGAHPLVEQAISITSRKIVKEDVPLAKLRADTRLRVAAMWNRDEFGAKPSQVNINLNTLHIDALRQAYIAPPTQSLAIADAIDTEYELLSDDNTTT